MSSQFIKGLRDLDVVVVHPPDQEGTNLFQHLKRIGCRVEAIWPPPRKAPPEADVLFLSMDYEGREAAARILRSIRPPGPTVIAVVDYENPTMVQMVLDSGALAVVEKPVRPFGLLTNLVLARSLWAERIEADGRTQKLERKLAGMRKIGRAKSILMQTQGLSEDDAYKCIRDQAMAKRTAMEDISVAIINAFDLLNIGKKDD